MTNSPIADLSYRNYDGPLEKARFRWWVIAKMTMRLALKKRVMWVAMSLSAWYFVAMIFVLFVADQLAKSTPGRPGQMNPMNSYIDRIVWKDQFLHGFSFGQIMFLAITLIIGAGAIANDNRSNALLVYLSKPCTKTDYLFGKWIGVFLPLLLTMLIPSLVFFLYGAMSYREYGFFFQDRWLLLKLLAALPLAAAVHSSLIIGLSSMFNQGRIAGASYAGIYFLTNFFTNLMTIMWMELQDGGGDSPLARASVSKLFYASVDGLNNGTMKAILGTNGSPYFGFPSRMEMVPAPPLWPFVGASLALIVVSLAIAWSRVRAVEVVG